MNGSNTEARRHVASSESERALIARFRRNPLGPYDVEVQAFLLPLRNLPARGKHALMRLPGQEAWTMVRLGDRDNAVQIIGGSWSSLADAEWAVFRARWMELRGWDPERLDE